jgi:hypothetical protein
MEEFEKLVAESFQAELVPAEDSTGASQPEPTQESAPAAESQPAPETLSEQEKAG